MTALDLRGRRLSLDRPAVMGIVNVTPDSFSDGGRFATRDAALRHIEQLAREGADLIDVGGESTRPGARPVGTDEELERVLPVIEGAASVSDRPVSVDTSRPEVMRAAVAAGAVMVNDVRALRVDGAIEAVRDTGVAVCLMHMQGEPRSMQSAPDYSDVVAQVGAFLAARRQACLEAGVDPGCIVLDPGFGFGKTLAHNLALLRHLDRLTGLGAPLLVGLSRKSMLGAIVDRPVDERVTASVAAALMAVERGARIVRVHDVRPTREALDIHAAVTGGDRRADSIA